LAEVARSSRLRSVAWWLLPVLGLMLLQTYLVFREPIFTPVDELEHTDYVRTIAEEARLPIYGQERIDPTLLAVYLHEYPGPFDPTHYQRLPQYIYLGYEALQFPVYYIVAAPVYKLFDRDPRAAIYALRMQNVAFSGALLLVLMLLLRGVFPGRPEIAALAPLTFLMMPGVSLRHSQVTNQVLAALLLAVLFALLLRNGKSNPGRVAFGEGALFGAAVLTKITVVGLGPSILAAWAAQTGGLRQRFAPGAAGFVLATLPWLVWSLAVYHSPLPWTAAHLDLSFCPCPAPIGINAWEHFVHDAWTNFVLPYEWAGTAMTCAATCTEVSPRTVLMRVGLVAFAIVSTASLGWGLFALRDRAARLWWPTLLSMLAIAGVLGGILALDGSLGRFAATDLREVYVFAAPVVLLLGGLAASISRRWTVLAMALILILWLAIDYQMYSASGCPGCPPQFFRTS
jgi:hypothetical protein